MIWCELENLDLSFGNHKVIADLTYQTRGCSFVGIVGPSGVGKSTILNMLAGVSQAKMNGNLRWFDNKGVLTKFPRPIGLVQQGSPLPGWLTVKKFMKMCTMRNGVDFEEIGELLELFQLTPNKVMNLFPHELSGGMKARVALAGAMNIGAKVLFLDEPFSGVDEPTRHELVELLAKKSLKSDCTNFLVSHSIKEVMYLSDTVLFLKKPVLGEYQTYGGFRGKAESLKDLIYGKLAKEFQIIEEEIEHESTQ